jgi:hypothetical protein
LYNFLSMRYFIIFIFFVLFFAACRKENFYKNSNAQLKFSTDTLLFDTVFTQRGTITKNIKVYNPYNQTLLISKIELTNAKDSIFRINIDGVSASSVEDIELKGGDSLYIFVEATLGRNNLNDPLIIQDSIQFLVNGNYQKIDLIAWGQDANYWASPTGSFGFYLLPNTPNVIITMPNDKPNVVFGYMIVDSTQTLVIPAGTKMHFHKYSGMAVAAHGTLKVEGTVDFPVIFEGDRLDAFYRDQPGQWGHPALEGGIILSAMSKENSFDYAIIRNGTFGLRVDSFFVSNQPTVNINNTIIHNMAYVGLMARGSNIVAANSVFSNGGLHSVALLFGGNYEFNHCTFANYWTYNSRKDGQLVINNFYESSSGSIVSRNLERADFNNCIVFGNKENEIVLNQTPRNGFDFNYQFNYSLVKTVEADINMNNFSNCIFNPADLTIDGRIRNPVFVGPYEDDFQLFEQSTALNKGFYLPIYQTDILGKIRSNPPDIGAYEFD